MAARVSPVSLPTPLPTYARETTAERFAEVPFSTSAGSAIMRGVPLAARLALA